MTDRLGEQFGKYRLTKVLGHGGFAEVYLGMHIHLGTEAAIKLLHTQLAGDKEVEQFRKEAQTIAKLIHPNIIRVLDFDVENGTPYLVMDYAPNGSLRTVLPQKTPLTPAAIFPPLSQIGEGLQYAHDQKFIHRDIKPENMLLGRRNEVLLSDFGIALVAQTSSAQSTQAVAGTAAYMAPEQLQGKPRQASDLYSLGVVVYEWLTGERPFQGSFTEVASQHILVPPPPLRQKVPTLSEAVEQVVLTALAKDPKERFGSVRAFVSAFGQAAVAPAPSSSFSTRPALPVSPVAPPEALVPGLPASGMVTAATQVTPPAPAVPPLAVEPFAPANHWSTSWLATPAAQVPLDGWGAMPAGPTPEPGDAPTFADTRFPPSMPPGSATPSAPGPAARTPGTALVLVSVIVLLVLLLGGTMTALGFSGKGPLAFFGPTATAGATVTTTFTGGHPSPTASATSTPTATPSATFTPTPDPNANPYPPYTGTLVLNDPLMNNSQGHQWDEYSNSGNACQFSGGTYQVVRAPHYGGPCFARATNFSSFTYQVDVTFLQQSSNQDSAGIVFRADPSDPGRKNYTLALYAGGKFYLEVCVPSSGQGEDCSQVVFQGTCSICTFGASALDRLAIVASGNSFTFYVNGQNVASGTDSTYSQGMIGVEGSAYDNPTIMAYQDARVWQ